MKRIYFIIASLFTITLFFHSSCLKKNFDAPPDLSGYDPQLPVNLTIAQLKAKLYLPTTQVIDSDWTIYGIVNADDRSGNFYKQINIEDSTGGITLLIDNYNLYTKYPVGRKIYVKLKGLFYGYYSKLPQIGGQPDNTGSISGIPGNSADNFIVTANFPNEVAVHSFTDLSLLKAVNQSMVGRLVQITNVQVVSTDTASTYAQPPTVASGTVITMEDCSGDKLGMRTSGYASFQSMKIPQGKGTITALYTLFGTTPQLIIRDTSDLKFHDIRCGSTGGNVLLNEHFENVSTSGNLTIAGWNNYTETGNEYYKGAGFSGNKFARISAYSNGADVVKTWLITPALNLSSVTNPILSFKTIDGYDNGATLKVSISTNYSGTGDPLSATWTELPAPVSSGHVSGYAPDWTLSGDVNLSAFPGTAYIAFKYEGADPAGTANDRTTTMELDDVVIAGD